MQTLVIIGAVVFLVWVYYMVQKRIGEDQQLEWERFKQDHPDWFPPPPEPLNVRRPKSSWSDAEKKSTSRNFGYDTVTTSERTETPTPSQNPTPHSRQTQFEG